MIIILFIIFHLYFSLFFQTFFHHRYAAHQMFSMSKTWEKIFFVGSWIGQGSSYLSPYVYGVLHRQHHAYTDTELDPHSPSYDETMMKMMLRTRDVYNNILYGKAELEPQFTKDMPKWTAFDTMAGHWGSRIFWGLFYIGFYLIFATEPWMYLLLPIHFLMGPIHGAVINWFAHKYGYTNFEVNNTSKNLLPLDFLMLGEGYHNNHHKRGSNPNFGFRWFELDPVYGVIRLFNAVGIIRLNENPVAEVH
jgi:stearoyl-CoA desaturase (delta-9 desaturase)